MTFPWVDPIAPPMPWTVAVTDAETAVDNMCAVPSSWLTHEPRSRPELVKNPITGLYPGQRDADDIPGFIKRVRMPDGTVRVGLENA